MAEHLRLAKRDGEPDAPPDFVLTDTALKIHRSLRMLSQLSGFRIGLICGTAGVGKTSALVAWQDIDPAASMVTAAGGEGDPKALSEDLCIRFRVEGWGNMSLTSRRMALLDYLASGSLLILDEAQHYALAAIEWVRCLCEEAGCNLVLAGDARLYAVAIGNAQIESRAVLPRLFKGVSAEDVRIIAKAHGLDRDGIPRELEQVTAQGGLRKVRNVTELARAFAAGGAVSGCHVRAAIDELGLKGGR